MVMSANGVTGYIKQDA